MCPLGEGGVTRLLAALARGYISTGLLRDTHPPKICAHINMCHSAGNCRPIVTEICDPMRILTDRNTKFGCDVVEKRCEEVYVFREN